MRQSRKSLTEEQIRILANLMMFGTVEQAAKAMAVDMSYVTSHFTDTHFAALCIDAVSSTSAEAASKGYTNYYDYTKTDLARRREAAAVSEVYESLNDNIEEEAIGPPLRSQLHRADFLQPVCLHGYEVSEGMVYDTLSREKDTIVGWKVIGDKHYIRGRDYRLYQPFRETPGLHRIFASLKPQAECMKAFCDQYGALWEPWDIFGSSREMDACHNNAIPTGYRLADYLKERQELNDAIIIYDTLMSGDAHTIRRLCEQPTDSGAINGALFFTRDCSSIPLGYLYAHLNEIVCSIVSWGFSRNEVITELVVAKHSSNGHFSAEIYRALVDDLNPGEDLTVQRLTRSDYYLTEPNGMELAYRPRNLAGTLWLMLAYEITGIKSYKQCQACGSWFEISELNDNRASRVYCDDNCRARAYRRRKAERG